MRLRSLLLLLGTAAQARRFQMPGGNEKRNFMVVEKGVKHTIDLD